MANLCLPLASPHLHLLSTKPHLTKPILPPKFTVGNIKKVRSYSGLNGIRSKSNGSVEASYKDENGVVDDMEGYLNSLSLEYDSVWDTKPSWCQPWTIVVTGVSVITCSWLILHSVIVTVLASSLICAWWYIFLYSYPKTYEQMISERRKRVTSGMEDTYGWSKEE